MNQGKRNEGSPQNGLFKYLKDSNFHQEAFLSFLSSRVQKRISIGLWICLVLLIWLVPHRVLEENLHPFVVAILPWAIMLAATWLSLSRGRCEVYERRVMAAEVKPDLFTLSSQPLILYLRSFVDDEKAGTLPVAKSNDPQGVGHENVPWYQTEEEQLKAVMNEFGYFLAIRKPDDAFPHAGASRIQVGHEWQEKVRELMAKSLFVVIRLGTTDGLLWELQTAVRYLEPCRLLLLVPFDEMEYNNFCNQYRDVFPKSLPRYDDEAEKCGTLRGMIWFQEDWTPEFLTLKLSDLYSPNYSLQSALKVSLLPFIDKLKLPYQPLQPSTGWMFKCCFLGSIACILFFAAVIFSPPNAPLWWRIPVAAIALILMAAICADIRKHYCLEKRFPGRY